MAGPQWLKSFLERNPEIALRQAEGLSIERAKGLNRTEVANFFKLLITTLTENNLLNKPDRIFNMDETGVQLNNKIGIVLAKKGSEIESDNTDIMKQEKVKTLRKRRLQIYSSDSSDSSESEENIFSSKTLKGKATIGLLIKRSKDEKSIRDTQKILKVKNDNLIVNTNKKVSTKKNDNYCAECYKNYNLTKSKSDWILCDTCQMWLHETCTTFKNYCQRCGKLETLAAGKN
ncbi:uncharacterized protein LOC123669955 [Melitaea cinxia]|uniref:uncharacterized protein LOC123658270 n=1 Tax=Melitaea cinxia TaxID=113334 RepID=UPI001E27005C|nr:uncharacterized protein LOC123658270 [Melitaea cinxia]XP_045459421.1 uncharacterized protein LOC123669955 [Melitaea cinxia]